MPVARMPAATDPGVFDVLDDLAEAALRSGGEVIVLEAARMPSRTGAAAVFRYQLDRKQVRKLPWP